MTLFEEGKRRCIIKTSPVPSNPYPSFGFSSIYQPSSLFTISEIHRARETPRPASNQRYILLNFLSGQPLLLDFDNADPGARPRRSLPVLHLRHLSLVPQKGQTLQRVSQVRLPPPLHNPLSVPPLPPFSPSLTSPLPSLPPPLPALPTHP